MRNWLYLYVNTAEWISTPCHVDRPTSLRSTHKSRRAMPTQNPDIHMLAFIHSFIRLYSFNRIWRRRIIMPRVPKPQFICISGVTDPRDIHWYASGMPRAWSQSCVQPQNTKLTIPSRQRSWMNHNSMSCHADGPTPLRSTHNSRCRLKTPTCMCWQPGRRRRVMLKVPKPQFVLISGVTELCDIHWYASGMPQAGSRAQVTSEAWNCQISAMIVPVHSQLCSLVHVWPFRITLKTAVTYRNAIFQIVCNQLCHNRKYKLELKHLIEINTFL